MKIVFPRDGCQAPQQYYTCASNGFKGCCSVDPCRLPGCPNAIKEGGDSAESQAPQPKSKATSAKSDAATGDGSSPTSAQAAASTRASSPPSTTQIVAPAFPSATPQPISTQSQATSQQPPGQPTSPQPAGPTSGSATSSQLPFTVVVVSTVQTPTSNGVALPPTTLLVTSTSYSSAGAAIQTSSSAPSAVSGSAPTSNTPVIGGVVGGVGVAVIAAALLWFCCRRRSKKRKDMREEKAAHGHEDDPREQGIDAYRAGDVIAGYRGNTVKALFITSVLSILGAGFDRGVDRHAKVKARESVAGSESTGTATEYGHHYEKKLPTPPITPNRQAYAEEEAVPYLDSTPVRPDLEMTGSSPNPIGFTPELSGVAAAHQPAELSPNPERLRINNRSAAYSAVGNAGPRTPAGAVMRSNLNLSGRGANRRAPNGGAPHVLSWMEYSPNASPRIDATDSSPTSGVWSSAESSNFGRNSGVSQDSSVHGWQRERRMKDGGGSAGLEAIADEPRS